MDKHSDEGLWIVLFSGLRICNVWNKYTHQHSLITFCSLINWELTNSWGPWRVITQFCISCFQFYRKCSYCSKLIVRTVYMVLIKTDSFFDYFRLIIWTKTWNQRLKKTFRWWGWLRLCKFLTEQMITKESGECLRRLRNNPLQEKTENMRNTNVTINYRRKPRMYAILT